jgi:DME family drug/metabolite transporter
VTHLRAAAGPRAVVAVLLAALCFATTGTAQELADVDASPMAVGLGRIVLGGTLLALAAAWTSRRARTSVSSRRARRVPAALVVLVGAAGVLAYQPTFFEGTRSNGVAVGTVVALGSAPVVTGVLDALLHRRVPGVRWGVATALALVGVACVSGLVGGSAEAGPAVLWSVGAGASYALYTLSAKELLGRGWSAGATMGVLFGVAALAAAPVLAAVAGSWLWSPRGLLLVVWLGVVTTAVAYLLFGWGLARLPASDVATLTLAEPLCATLLGVGLLAERLDPLALVGLVVLAVGLLVLATGARGRTAPAPLTGAA